MEMEYAVVSIPPSSNEALRALRLPRYEELPRIGLYMDQLVEVLENALAPLATSGEKPITSAMVNNYVKQGVLAAPQAKRYTCDHVACLVIIGVLKQSFSIGEIAYLIRAQLAQREIGAAYNRFCDTLEEACATLAGGVPAKTEGLSNVKPNGKSKGGKGKGKGAVSSDDAQGLVTAACRAVAYSLYLRARIDAYGGAELRPPRKGKTARKQ